jgi:hydroxyacyl-ACP dehydratase HTD2-like protein with hotdog domain
MTNVLIPTDFTVRTLDIVTAAAQNIPGKLNVFMFHAFDMPDSLIDAMHRTGLNSHYNLITEELRMKCRQIKAACPDVSNISFRLMFGTTVAAFKNFAEANDIHVIVYPAGYSFLPVVRESVNPDRMFLKSRITVLRNLSLKGKVAGNTPVVHAEQTMAEAGLVMQ